MGPFEIMDLNAPEGIKDSFTRYRTGIQNLAKQQNTVPSYSDEYLNKLDKEQRQRLAYNDRIDRIEKRNKMIALIRKLKISPIIVEAIKILVNLYTNTKLKEKKLFFFKKINKIIELNQDDIVVAIGIIIKPIFSK